MDTGIRDVNRRVVASGGKVQPWSVRAGTKSRVKVDTVMLVGLLGSSADYEASFNVPSLFAGRVSNVGPPGISETFAGLSLMVTSRQPDA